MAQDQLQQNLVYTAVTCRLTGLQEVLNQRSD